MSTFDFGGSGIRSWLNQGMVVLSSPNAPAPLKVNRVATFVSSARTRSVIFALMIGTNFCAVAQTVNLPNQNAFACSHVPEPSYLTKRTLLESLNSIASLGNNWQGQEAPAPSRRAVTAAQQIVPSLPNIIADASVGVDGDGNVYFKLRNGEKLAYLTVEPSTMHLLVMAPGQKNVYLDDVNFRPRELPSKIRRTIEQEMSR